MNYIFDVNYAIQYGVNEAIMISNLQFWIQKNKENNKNYYDGHYWTYNSNTAFQKLFPFWTQNQIRRIIDNLVKSGVIIKGNYNESPYNKTSWYAFADEDKFLFTYNEYQKNNEIPICEKTQMENVKNTNRLAKKDKYIITSDINTDINNIYNINSPTSTKDKNEEFMPLANSLKEYIETQYNKKIDNKTLNNYANTIRLLHNSLSNREDAKNDILKAIDYLKNENSKQGKYMLVIESATAFREKFSRIEDKMQRNISCSSNGINYKEMEKYIL